MQEEICARLGNQEEVYWNYTSMISGWEVTCSRPPMTLSKPYLFFKHLPDLGAGTIGSSCLVQKVLETLTQYALFIPIPARVGNKWQEFEGALMFWSRCCSQQQLKIGASPWQTLATACCNSVTVGSTGELTPPHQSANGCQFSETGRTTACSRTELWLHRPAMVCKTCFCKRLRAERVRVWPKLRFWFHSSHWHCQHYAVSWTNSQKLPFLKTISLVQNARIQGCAQYSLGRKGLRLESLAHNQ